MLYFEAHKNLKDCVHGECTRIVIYGDNKEPVAFVLQVGKDAYLASHIGNADFDKLIQEFNIDKLDIKYEK